MPKIKSFKDQKREELNMPIWTPKELKEFDAELDPYMIEKELTLRGETRMVRYIPKEGWEKFYFDKGICSKDFAIKDILKFRLMQDKIEQYHDWIRRKDFAIKMNEQNYESMVEEMGGNDIGEMPF